MNKLTAAEIIKYTKAVDKSSGVDGITPEVLARIDLSKVREVVRDGDRLMSSAGKQGKQIFKLDNFTPRLKSYFFKPSFAGSQVLLGRQGRELFFSDGRWFVGSV